MLRRLLLYTILIAAVAGFFLMRRETRGTSQVVAAAAAPSLQSSVASRPTHGRHLLPDARFLAAVGDVEHIVTGAPARSASALFHDGVWSIRSGEREVGRLSEFPRYEELLGTLREWAVALGARESLAHSAGPVAPRVASGLETELAALHAIRAAGAVDRAWAEGHRDPATVRRAARALTWMAAECTDPATAGEAIAARALAWTALAAVADSNARRESVLLAAVMGYPGEADAAAASLAPNDPIRLYARREDETLDAIASRGGSAREARWLALRRCVERRSLEDWSVAADRGFDEDSVMVLPLLGSAIGLGRFETNMAAGQLLLLAIAVDLKFNENTPAPIAAVENRPTGEAMELFETLLDAMPESADGVVLDRELLRGWYRAAFYSSLMNIGEHLRKQLSDTEGTRRFASEMGDGTTGPAAAAEFQGWFAHLADLKVSGKVRGLVKADLHLLKHFGAGLPLVTWDAISERTNHSDPFIRQCAPLLQKKLDTRPDHLHEWGWIVMSELFDVPEGEAMIGAAAMASHPRDLARRGWWAAYRGDRPTLDALLADPSFRPEERGALLRALRVMAPEDSLRLDALSEQMIAESPDDWQIAREYVRALGRRHRTDRVREITRAWLARPDRSARAFDDIEARNRLAAACLEDGRIEEGYQAIGPVVGSWQQEAMSLGAELLDRKGRGADAETLAVMAWQRYPDSDVAQALAVDLWWRHGKFEMATRALSAGPRPMTGDGWRYDLGKRFVRFERERPKDARRAVDALVAAKLDGWEQLGGLVGALAAAGRKDAAAEFSKRVRGEGQAEQAMLISAYVNVRAARGRDEAEKWLKTSTAGLSPDRVTYLHYFAYGRSASEVLWLLPMPTGTEDTIENLWLLRACAAARDSETTPEQWSTVRTHFERPGPNRYRHFARLLLGVEPVDSILAMRLDNRAEGEADYYIGLWRQCQGDVRGAAEWYSRCLDVNVWNNAEHFWSMEQLMAWVNRSRSLERLGQEERRRRGRDLAT